MSDKFDKMSIYDVDWKSTDNDGNEQTFSFKPLPFKYYPKIYKVISRLQDLDFDDSLSEEDQAKQFMKNLDEELVSNIMEI